MSEEKKVEEGKEESRIEVNNDTTETQAQSNPHEEKASSLGWVSKEEWVEQGKDPDDWKPAKVFLEHGDMIGKIRNQSKELEESRRAITFMHEKHKTAYEKGYQNALADLRNQKRAALADGDFVKADEIDEKIDATKEALEQVKNTPPPVPQTQQVDPDHVEWVQRNPWYTEPRLMRYADSIAIDYINEQKKLGNPLTANQVRKYVEEEVKKEFPHKFPQRAKGPPTPDGEGRATGKTSTNGLDPKLAKVESNMTEEERQIMRTLLKSTGMTKEKYLKQYAS